jgi:syntaxin 18
MMNPEEEAMNVLLSTHRGAVTWFLSKKLSEASDIQRNQQEVRLMREVEKSKRYKSLFFKGLMISMVNRPPRYKTMNSTQTSRSKEIEAEQKFESTLSQEQLQVLEEENNSLLDEFERTLDQIKYSLPFSPQN